jgi:hypothetical protein
MSATADKTDAVALLEAGATRQRATIGIFFIIFFFYFLYLSTTTTSKFPVST